MAEEYKVYGYARVSTKKQVIDRQIENIKGAYPSAEIIREVYTDKQVEGRKEFIKLLKKVEAGDTIVFDEISRMSRNRDEGFKLYMELYERGVELVFLKEPHLNTAMYREKINNQIDLNIAEENTTEGEYHGKATSNFINALKDALNQLARELIEDNIALAFDRAQKEREYLVKRTQEGLDEAVRKGKTLGLPKGSKPTELTAKETKAKKTITEYSKDFGGNLNDSQCMVLADVSRRTFYKYKLELLARCGSGEG